MKRSDFRFYFSFPFVYRRCGCHAELGSASVRSGSRIGLTNVSNAYIYIVSNIERTTLYIGVTNDLNRRVWEHKQGKASEFTTKYKCTILLYAEEHGTISDAIEREKQLKQWKRQWKWELIRKLNPELVDLYPLLRG